MVIYQLAFITLVRGVSEKDAENTQKEHSISGAKISRLATARQYQTYTPEELK